MAAQRRPDCIAANIMYVYSYTALIRVPWKTPQKRVIVSIVPTMMLFSQSVFPWRFEPARVGIHNPGEQEPKKSKRNPIWWRCSKILKTSRPCASFIRRSGWLRFTEPGPVQRPATYLVAAIVWRIFVVALCVLGDPVRS